MQRTDRAFTESIDSFGFGQVSYRGGKASERLASHIDAIVDAMPHGSGIDDDWCIDESVRGFRAFNSYHCMDEGMYDKWFDFGATYTWDAAKDCYTLTRVHGRNGCRETGSAWGLIEYLWDVLPRAINAEGIVSEQGFYTPLNPDQNPTSAYYSLEAVLPYI